jgi:predicted enzyme related to lactoylglutathione lyase
MPNQPPTNAERGIHAASARQPKAYISKLRKPHKNMINSIAFTVYPVSNVPKSRQFYEGILGLKVDHNFQDRWVEYDIAGQTFAISDMMTDNQPGAQGAGIGFEVDDLDQTLAHLKAANVKFLMEAFSSPVCRMAVIADPDGNGIVIHKRNQ